MVFIVNGRRRVVRGLGWDGRRKYAEGKIVVQANQCLRACNNNNSIILLLFCLGPHLQACSIEIPGYSS